LEDDLYTERREQKGKKGEGKKGGCQRVLSRRVALLFTFYFEKISNLPKSFTNNTENKCLPFT